MPKIHKEQIDEEGKIILSELLQNAKASINSIAKHCHVSEQKVRRMIHQLEEHHMIWGYSTIIDEEKLGLKHFVLMAKRSGMKVDEEMVDQIISRKLEDISYEEGITIESSFYVHGEYDWIITFTAKDILKARKFADTLAVLNKGIIEKIIILQTLMFMRKHYVLNPERMKLKEFL
jgi:DNA-binding Lrp family transcriptional regulator